MFFLVFRRRRLAGAGKRVVRFRQHKPLARSSRVSGRAAAGVRSFSLFLFLVVDSLVFSGEYLF